MCRRNFARAKLRLFSFISLLVIYKKIISAYFSARNNPVSPGCLMPGYKDKRMSQPLRGCGLMKFAVDMLISFSAENQ